MEKSANMPKEKKDWHKPALTEINVNRDTASAEGDGDDYFHSGTKSS